MANPARALASRDVRIDFSSKMFQHRLDRCGHDLTKAADGRQGHGLTKLVEQGEALPILAFRETASRPVNEHLGHLLRTDPAGHPLAAGFVAAKTATED